MQTLFLNLIKKASDLGASDVYLLPRGNQVLVALFAKNAFKPLQSLSSTEGGKLLRYIKYRAQMDLGEQRRPQAGHVTLTVKDSRLHLRVSTVGDFLNQESLVLRILYDIAQHDLRWPETFTSPFFEKWLRAQSGLILFGGAIGTGKTSCMHYLAHRYLKDRFIVTIEDPVEIVQTHFLQLQVNLPLGMDYTALIQLALRHHPEVLVIGEIRDRATAMASIKAALSGHLVLATLHLRSLTGVYARLKSLGIPQQLSQMALTQVLFLSGKPMAQHVSLMKAIN